MTTIQRKITPTFDRKGDPQWQWVMSPPDDSVASLDMIPDRIIPVIFVPGVMGSNLKGKGTNGASVWHADSLQTMSAWLRRGPRTRKELLRPDLTDLDDAGAVEEMAAQHPEELLRRGWGEVAAMSYGPFLVWLEDALNDFHVARSGLRSQLVGRVLEAEKGEQALTSDEVGLSYRYRFAVHACGYNWLESNAVSAERLRARIIEVITRYRKERKRCEKVILVTHSMGGLVARHCSEVLCMRDHILGIVHGVMPDQGAAAVYRRFKAGVEGSGIEGYVASEILGNDAAEMTAVMSSAPGPLQLLPTPAYGNGWLKIKDGAQLHALPASGDPYAEIYTVRGKWWSMCDDQLTNPLNEERDAQRRQAQVDVDWQAFNDMITDQVRPFHRAVEGKYHPHTHAFYGADRQFSAYGTVTWTASNSLGESWWQGDRASDALAARPLDTTEIKSDRTVATPLRGKGWKTGIHQTYSLSDPDEEGDGTVPRRSGAALLSRPSVRSVLKVSVAHEPAFRASPEAQRFTLRAIVQIAQDIQQVARMKYDE